MKSRFKSTRGFTLVELLIVIVVIAILAAITIVVYNGIQGRARDSKRQADVNSIITALELYKTQNGSYPPTDATTTALCSSHNNGYGYSDATDGTWLKSLISSGVISTTPVAPGNDCSSYYRYLHPSAASYGCTGLRTTSYYILQIIGTDGGSPPTSAVSGTFTPCAGATAGWGTDSHAWTFERDDS